MHLESNTAPYGLLRLFNLLKLDLKHLIKDREVLLEVIGPQSESDLKVSLLQLRVNTVSKLFKLQIQAIEAGSLLLIYRKDFLAEELHLLIHDSRLLLDSGYGSLNTSDVRGHQVFELLICLLHLENFLSNIVYLIIVVDGHLHSGFQLVLGSLDYLLYCLEPLLGIVLLNLNLLLQIEHSALELSHHLSFEGNVPQVTILNLDARLEHLLEVVDFLVLLLNRVGVCGELAN